MIHHENWNLASSRTRSSDGIYIAWRSFPTVRKLELPAFDILESLQGRHHRRQNEWARTGRSGLVRDAPDRGERLLNILESWLLVWTKLSRGFEELGLPWWPHASQPLRRLRRTSPHLSVEMIRLWIQLAAQFQRPHKQTSEPARDHAHARYLWQSRRSNAFKLVARTSTSICVWGIWATLNFWFQFRVFNIYTPLSLICKSAVLSLSVASSSRDLISWPTVRCRNIGVQIWDSRTAYSKSGSSFPLNRRIAAELYWPLLEQGLTFHCFSVSVRAQ